MSSDCFTGKSVVYKKQYQAPKLTDFGSVTKLTQNGSAVTKENNGMSSCGPTFAKSGGTSC